MSTTTPVTPATPAPSITPAGVFGSAPGPTWRDRMRLALLRALRTLVQGLAGAFPTAGAGMMVLSTGYWQAFGYACLAAVVAAAVSFLQNVAEFLPTGA